MFLYFLKLSWLNFKRTPSLYGLALLTLSIGIGFFIANVAIVHIMTGNPIPDKSDKLFHVSMNTWNNNQPWRQPMNILRYSETQAILSSKVPFQVSASYASEGYPKVANRPNALRHQASIRAVSSDFFSMMNAPFAKGQSFSSPNAQEVVISHRLKQNLFGDRSCIGQTLDLSGKLYTIVGELQPWRVRPLFYHPEIGAYRQTEDLFLPLETAIDNNVYVQGQSSSNDYWNTMADTRERSVFYLQVWVLLDNLSQYQAMQDFLNNYSQDLKVLGGHPNAVLNKLHNVSEWLNENKVVNQKVVAFSIATALFLIVCVFNASSLLLVRFNHNFFDIGLRRALGAKRKYIFWQEAIQAVLFGVFSALISLVVAKFFLMISIIFLPFLKSVAILDVKVALGGSVLAILTAMICSLYPLLINAHKNLSSQLKGS